MENGRFAFLSPHLGGGLGVQCSS